jgi:hypothetical protein
MKVPHSSAANIRACSVRHRFGTLNGCELLERKPSSYLLQMAATLNQLNIKVPAT